MDIDDGRQVAHDIDGSDHDDARSARHGAIERLAQVVQNIPSEDGERSFRVDLRDDRHKVILRATLFLRSSGIEPS